MFWALVIFMCDGHVNARCWPEVKTYISQEECLANIKEKNRGWSTKRSGAICLPLSSAPSSSKED